MNQLSGAEAFVRMLQLHGVKHIFGLCGDTSLPFYDALARLDHGIIHILTRDERCAAYMADAYARVTGRVGVCEGPSGGGATYILPGVVEANESSFPVLAITSDISVAARGKFALTEIDQEALFRPLTKFTHVLDSAKEIAPTIRRAFRTMTTGRPGAAHIGLPFDVQKAPVDEADLWAEPDVQTYPARRPAPDAASVTAAAEAILAAREPILVCGGGPVLAGAQQEVLAIAEMLEIPVATTVSGKGVIAEDHPLAVGVVGSNGGTRPTRAMMEAADLFVFVGCRAGSVTTERWRFPAAGARIVHIDVDPSVIGTNYPVEAAVVGDARLALAALRAELEGRTAARSSRAGRAAVARAKAEKFAAFRELATTSERPIRPERLIATLQDLLPADAVVCADPGTPCPYFSAYYEFRASGRHFITNRAHGALGFALPAAIGAAVGRPQAKVIAVMGDGSFGFSCGEMETLVRLGLPVTLIVVSNSVFGWIKAGQRSAYGGRYFSVDFGRSDHARIAEAFGLRSWRVEDPADLAPVLKRALEAEGPTLVDVISQPLHEARAPVSEWVA